MRRFNGFTLIETLITTLVLVTGLAAVAGLFSYGAQSNLRNRERTAATTLLYSKMDELKTSESLSPGQYSEYLSVKADGRVVQEDDRSAPYLRTWKISSSSPRAVTVIVYGKQGGRGNLYRELARATTLLADKF